MPDVHPKIE